MVDTVKTSFSVSETTFQQIRLAAQKSGKTISEIVRMLLLRALKQNAAVKPSSRPTIEYAVGPCIRKIYVGLSPTMLQALGSLRAWRRLSISALLATVVKWLSSLDGQCCSSGNEPGFVNILSQEKTGAWQWITKIQFAGWLPPPS